MKAPRQGIYHFSKSGTEGKSHLHLRIDPDGSGILLINANRLFHLNPSAALMAHSILNEHSEKQTIKEICHHFNVLKATASSDLVSFKSTFLEMIKPDGPCPIHALDIDVIHPFSKRPSAPYRMDLALTYLCNNDCTHCYNVKSRNLQELSTKDWKKVIDRLWEIGIPHVVFTGGEPTLRQDLVELVEYASTKGQITGLNTNGRRLQDKRFVEDLVAAGLDHVQITLESHDPLIHDEMVRHKGAWKETTAGIKNAVESELYVMTNSTLLQSNSGSLSELLDLLASFKVPTVGLNSLIHSGRGEKVTSGLSDDVLPGLLEIAKKKTSANHQRLIWYTPTQYCHFDPVLWELGVKGCSAALYNMCVEPDGSVIPCQSYYSPVGNILTSAWESIWNHDLAIQLRERRNAPTECLLCPVFSECGGGCPLSMHLSKPILPKIPIAV